MQRVTAASGFEPGPAFMSQSSMNPSVPNYMWFNNNMYWDVFGQHNAEFDYLLQKVRHARYMSFVTMHLVINTCASVSHVTMQLHVTGRCMLMCYVFASDRQACWQSGTSCSCAWSHTGLVSRLPQVSTVTEIGTGCFTVPPCMVFHISYIPNPCGLMLYRWPLVRCQHWIFPPTTCNASSTRLLLQYTAQTRGP